MKTRPMAPPITPPRAVADRGSMAQGRVCRNVATDGAEILASLHGTDRPVALPFGGTYHSITMSDHDRPPRRRALRRDMPVPHYLDAIARRRQGGETVWTCERAAAKLEESLDALVATATRYQPPGPGR
jgi:hypothetical protein